MALALGLALQAAIPTSARAQLAEPDSAFASVQSPAATPAIPPPRIGGYIQAREIVQPGVGLTSVLNRARFSIDGALPSRFSYRALVEMEASAGARAPATPSLREAIVRWSPAPFALTVGEFKTPFTREYLIPVPALELADLAMVVDSLAPRYDVGVMAECALGAAATLAAGVFNGEGANSTVNRDSSVLAVGRVTARPLPQLSLGASAARDAADSLRWGCDASIQQSGVAARAECVARHRRGRARGQDDFGWYVLETARVVPRLQLVARQEEFQRPALGAAGRTRGNAWGANVELAPGRVRLLLEFSCRWSGRAPTRSEGFIAQLQGQL